MSPRYWLWSWSRCSPPAPNSKYPLIAGYRFIGLMLAYEMPFAITIIAVALPTESLALGDIVAAQKAITFLMMIGEMMIMVMFMVAFMMNPAGLNPMSMVHQPRVAAGAGRFGGRSGVSTCAS
jgi:NADH:ubiquinone oxidoreductase subunit H